MLKVNIKDFNKHIVETEYDGHNKNVQKYGNYINPFQK